MKSFWEFKKKNLNEVVQNVLALLSEATIKSTGTDAARHAKKYVLTDPMNVLSRNEGGNPQKVSKEIFDLKEKVLNGTATNGDLVSSPLRLNKAATSKNGIELPEGAFLVPHMTHKEHGVIKGFQKKAAQLLSKGMKPDQVKKAMSDEISSMYPETSFEGKANGKSFVYKGSIQGTGENKKEALSSLFYVYDKQGNQIGDGPHRIHHHLIIKGTHHTGKYNYEHAVTRLYNYYVQNYHKKGKSLPTSLEDIVSEINEHQYGSQPKTDKKKKPIPLETGNSPLHMDQADDVHFAGGLPKLKNGKRDKKHAVFKKAIKSHNAAFQEVASTVFALLNHKDFQESIKRGDELVASGTQVSEASELAKKVHGGPLKAKSLTNKVDNFVLRNNGQSLSKEDHKGAKILQGEQRISLKKEKAQIHSNYGKDSEIVLRAAANHYFLGGKKARDTSYNEKTRMPLYDKKGNVLRDEKGKIQYSEVKPTKKGTQQLIKTEFSNFKTNEEKADHVANLISHLRHYMDNGDHVMSTKLMQHLHENLPREGKIGEKTSKPGFLRLVYRYAATGEGKFENHEGTATHMGETGTYGSIHPIDEYLDLAEKSGQINISNDGIRFQKAKHKEKTKEGEERGSIMRIANPQAKLFPFSGDIASVKEKYKTAKSEIQSAISRGPTKSRPSDSETKTTPVESGTFEGSMANASNEVLTKGRAQRSVIGQVIKTVAGKVARKSKVRDVVTEAIQIVAAKRKAGA